jgi:hypothetical protein
MIVDKKRFIIALSITLTLLGLIIFMIYSLVMLTTSQAKLSQVQKNALLTPTPVRELSDADIVARAGKHILLPAGIPKVITIGEVEKLKSEQPFFANAVNGDKLLVYPSKAIIYRVSSDLIIEVAEINSKK